MEDAYFRSCDDILEVFGTDPETGLSTKQVQENLKRYGKNELPPPAKSSWFKLVLKQFEDLLVLILLGSAMVSLILGFLEHNEGDGYTEIFIEPSVIMLILIANAIVGVYQESSAEEAIEKLKKFEANSARVLRNGQIIEIERTDVVPGDILVLSVGEKIPADCRLLSLSSKTIRTNESMLTGESVAQLKTTSLIKKAKNDLVDQDKKNILFSGTLLVHGKCRAIVVLTGGHTSMGKIQEGLMGEDDHKTPLGEKLDDFAEFLSKVILGICIVVWLININHFSEHGGFFKGAIYYFKIAVALAVAAIPEGLPAVVTTCLALGTMKMAKKNAIVRSLPSVETLGCTTVICSDKTGTLTTNQMSVRKVLILNKQQVSGLNFGEFDIKGTTYKPEGDIIENNQKLKYPGNKNSLKWISQVSCLCNDSSLSFEKNNETNIIEWKITGEPTEAALLVLAEKLGLPDVEEAVKNEDINILKKYNSVSNYWKNLCKKELTLEFTRDRKSMSVFVHNNEDENNYLLVKGAPESLLSRSTNFYCNKNDKEYKINKNIIKSIEQQYVKFASQGLRCLGIAYKNLEKNTINIDDDEHFERIEKDLTFVGIVGMLDPPRTEVKDSIEICRNAGIRVIVITGDNKKTAEAICREIGIFTKNENISNKSYLGSEFKSLNNEQQLKAVREASLFSRVMPSHKQMIVDLLQHHKEVVAMTGDGVNDAPALSKADIGIAMGSGTEVARHSGDMILSDDNFSTIVSAVEEGRAIYANTKQFIRYLISSNIGEVACIFLVAALGLPEALIPVQLLWVNLVTDGLPATALGFNKPDQDIMIHPPRGRNERIIDGWMFFRYLLIGIYIGIGTVLGFVWWFCWYDDGPQITFGQITHFHACENTNSSYHDYYFKNNNIDCEIFKNNRPCTMSLTILVLIEMFNTFNALSENQSLLSVTPWSNIYVILAVILSILLHCMILYIDFFVHIFSTAPLNSNEWLACIFISFPVIILDEFLKAISRSYATRTEGTIKKRN